MKSIRSTIVVALALALPFATTGCKKDDGTNETSKRATTPAAAPANAATPVASDHSTVTAAFDAVMVAYETCRNLLAADKSDGVADCAKAVDEAATEGRSKVPSAAQHHMAAIAVAAAGLASSQADDVEAQRLAFGELSKLVIALLIDWPEAAAKYHVFECPMAKGFNRWVQPDAELANPYMGTKMLECGSEVHAHHPGMKGESMKHTGGRMDHEGGM